MGEFENAIPKEERELKSRTDEVISQVDKLSEEDLSPVAGGSDAQMEQNDGCVLYSRFACLQSQCDQAIGFDCASSYRHE